MRAHSRSRGLLVAGLTLALMLPLRADAQRLTPAAVPAEKSRLVAFGLGYLFPGAGHFYAGESWRGANIVGIVVGGFMLAGSTENESTAGNIALTSMVVYLWSMVDAPMAANRHNRRLRGQAPSTP